MSQMSAIANRSRTVNGVPMSLCDLGYCDVGLDDNWQACGKYGPNGYSFHDANGRPVVNQQRFPDFIAMTTYAHSLGLTAGWYGNNCICSDHCSDETCYQGDVDAVMDYGFDSIKLDGCGRELDLTLYAQLFNNTGKSILIENCHWGGTIPNATCEKPLPSLLFRRRRDQPPLTFNPTNPYEHRDPHVPNHKTPTGCPWNYYRSSGDIRASYDAVVGNLQTTIPLAQQGLSTPGCWAYPDMLEVGCQHGPGGPSDPGLSLVEARTHFNAWCIVSSPLILSHDLTNDTISDAVWPIISNQEALAVSKAWAGESGTVFKSASETVMLGKGAPSVAAWQWFSKKIDDSSVAVLLMNHGASTVSWTREFSQIPRRPGARPAVIENLTPETAAHPLSPSHLVTLSLCLVSPRSQPRGRARLRRHLLVQAARHQRARGRRHRLRLRAREQRGESRRAVLADHQGVKRRERERAQNQRGKW